MYRCQTHERTRLDYRITEKTGFVAPGVPAQGHYNRYNALSANRDRGVAQNSIESRNEANDTQENFGCLKVVLLLNTQSFIVLRENRRVRLHVHVCV